MDVESCLLYTSQKMYTQMQQETETETECEEMLIDYMNRILSQKIFTTMEDVYKRQIRIRSRITAIMTARI